MRLETNPEQRQEIQESFDLHLKDIVDGSITDIQIDLSSYPVMYNIESLSMYHEKRTFTYEGYTQDGKRFILIIDE